MPFRAFWHPRSFNPDDGNKRGGRGQENSNPVTSSRVQQRKQQAATSDGYAKYGSKKGGQR